MTKKSLSGIKFQRRAFPKQKRPMASVLAHWSMFILLEKEQYNNVIQEKNPANRVYEHESH